MMPDLGARSRVEVVSSSGYNTPAAEGRRCVRRVTRFESGDVGVFIGDLDPTGETQMDRAVLEDHSWMRHDWLDVVTTRRPVVGLMFERVVLTMAQVAEA